LLAQDTTPTELSGAAAAGVFGGVCIFQLIMIAIWLFVAIWIMRDAKSRQSENAQLVTILGWLVPVVGLIVHLATRPNVNLVPCPHCKKKRIEGSAVCPHCGQP